MTDTKDTSFVFVDHVRLLLAWIPFLIWNVQERYHTVSRVSGLIGEEDKRLQRASQTPLGRSRNKRTEGSQKY
jgi:hypothetical protein